MKTSALLFLIILTSCAVTKNTPEAETTYFEGIVEFDIEYETLNYENFNVEYFKLNRPNRSILYFENGNYIEDYFLGDSLIETITYKWEETKSYFQSADSDTIYVSDASKSRLTTDIAKSTEGETILGYQTQKIWSLMRDKESGTEIKQSYSNCMELPINPEHYATFTEGRYNELIKKHPGISLKTELILFDNIKTTETATSVEWKDIELDLTIDSTKVLIGL